MNPPRKHPRPAHGFALPMVMIATAAIFLLVIALISTNSLERKTARAFSDAARAEFAVEAGLAIALADLSELACRDDSLVFRLEDTQQPTVAAEQRPLGYREQPFTYGAVFQDQAWQAIPLFSGATRTSLGDRELHADVLKSQLADYTNKAEVLGQITSHTQQIPRARWVELPVDRENPAAQRLRYAFWIEDLGGRLPGKAVNKEPRTDGLSSGQIDISTLLDTELETGPLPAPMEDKRDTLRSSASLRHLLTTAQAARIEPHIHYHPWSAAESFLQIIPQGFGYVDAGLKAPDLNTFLDEADVDGLAAHIARNLPNFEQRKGGFPDDQDYLKTIAASIIDYADPDQDATVGAGYRGVDSYPFVNELFDRYEWVETPPGSVSIEVSTYIELWNPSNQAIAGELTFNNINKRRIQLGGNGWKDFSSASFGPLDITMPPNGFRVIALGTSTQNFAVELEPVEPLTFNAEDEESSFELFWNGTLVDRPRGGVQRTFSFLRAGLGETKWKGNSAPPNDFTRGQVGDPRASSYITDAFQKSDYGKNSNWGGRAYRKTIDTSMPFREVRLEKWPDRGSNSAIGIASGTDARVPTETHIILKSTGQPVDPPRNFPANQPELAPARISNAGQYRSLGELGNIFDPAQWKDIAEASASESPAAGGGITLAVGRPEFAAFDAQGRRAAQLLDLFSLKKTPAPNCRPININTAPREVLRSLVAGVTLDADPVATELEIAKHPSHQRIGDIFAEVVIAHRNQRPLRAASDLNLIREDPGQPRVHGSETNQPFFGNPANFSGVPTIPERGNPDQEYDQSIYREWNDAGREELFRKVMDLVCYRSDLFRIVVAGQVLDAAGEPVSVSVREYHFAIIPQRSADGTIVPGAPPSIRKLYEQSL